MNEIKGGGPAFPADPACFDPKTLDEAERLASGMSLRDYFAAKAMQTILSKVIEVNGSLTTYQVALATEGAYVIADAMLRVREGLL